MRLNSKISIFSFLGVMLALFSSCEKTKSYSELLKEEEQAVNWFLAQKKVALEIPENNDFQIGEDAPFYRMDPDGFVYMQVIRKGDLENKPQEGDRVYFRFMRQNIKSLYESGSAIWEGNATDFGGTSSSTSFILGNTVLTTTTQYGEGIQLPLDYLGYDSEVNLVIKSNEGFTSDASQCVPYLYNVRYFKAQY